MTDRFSQRWPLRTRVLQNPEVAVIAIGTIAGLFVLAVVALENGDARVPVDFFAVAAQVFPVFLVALAVEQRLVDRLGISEEQYVQKAEGALGTAVNAQMAYEDGDKDEAYRIMDRVSSQRDVAWVAAYAYDALAGNPDLDIAAMARVRYRRRRGGEIVLVVAVTVFLLLGEIVALVGLLMDGTGPRSAPYMATISLLVGTFVMITLAAFRELLPAAPD